MCSVCSWYVILCALSAARVAKRAPSHYFIHFPEKVLVTRCCVWYAGCSRTSQIHVLNKLITVLVIWQRTLSCNTASSDGRTCGRKWLSKKSSRWTEFTVVPERTHHNTWIWLSDYHVPVDVHLTVSSPQCHMNRNVCHPLQGSNKERFHLRVHNESHALWRLTCVATCQVVWQVLWTDFPRFHMLVGFLPTSWRVHRYDNNTTRLSMCVPQASSMPSWHLWVFIFGQLGFW
jgi:hypothetical protein